MTQEEIIEMVVKCGIIPWTKHEYIGDQKFTATDEGLDGDLASLIQFFQMATAHEREACAKVCEAWVKDHAKTDNCTYADCDFVAAAIDCAEAIRARGNNDQPV